MSAHSRLLLLLLAALAIAAASCGGDDDDAGPNGGQAGYQPSGAGPTAGRGGISASSGGNAGVAGAAGAASGSSGSQCEAGELVVTGVWRPVELQAASSPSARFALSVAPMGDDLLLFGGGTLLTGGSNETWVYDLVGGRRWTNVTPNIAPPARGAQALALLEEGSALMFGGQGLALYNDTWLWNGKTWEDVCTAEECGTPPIARAGHSLALDPERVSVLLVGGQNGDTVVGDTWAWSETTGWQQLCADQCPEDAAACCGYGARFNHAAAFDVESQALYVHGGHDGADELDSLWAFGEGAWQDVEVDASRERPGPRSGHNMATASDTSLLVLHGGTNRGVAVTDDLWAFESSTRRWFQVRVEGEKPEARAYAGFAFDEARNQFVLFGGAGQGAKADLWILTVTKEEVPTQCSCEDACLSCAQGDVEACPKLCESDFAFPDTRCAELLPNPGGGGSGGGGNAPTAGAPPVSPDPNACEVLADCCAPLPFQQQLACEAAVDSSNPATCEALLDYCD